MNEPLQQNSSQEQLNQTVVENNSGAEPMADRTKEQFEKLTGSNQTLNQENERLRKELESLKAPAPAPLPQPTVQQSIQQAQASGVNPAAYVEVDPNTGERFVNETKLEKVLSDIQSKTSQVEQNFQTYVKTAEETRLQQQRELAFKAHPELEPGKEGFNKDFYRRVKETIYGSMLDPAEYGKVLSIKEAADYVKGETTKTPLDNPEINKEDGQGGAKAEAGMQIPSTPQNAPQPTNSEELMHLRMQTRKGNTDALAQRLLATDHVLNKQ